MRYLMTPSLSLVSLVLAVLLPVPALAEGGEEEEVTTAVEATYAYMREHLASPPDSTSEAGALQFWSSGGLVISVAAGASGTEYESFDIHPKHITVLRLSDDSAAVIYYAEGSMTPKGSAPVEHYLTRVLEVYVKENGAWKVRAGHWSPLRGGGGTSRATD